MPVGLRRKLPGHLNHQALESSRADKYPELSLLLKQLGPFEFYDHFGESLEDENAPPPAYFKLPQICKHL